MNRYSGNLIYACGDYYNVFEYDNCEPNFLQNGRLVLKGSKEYIEVLKVHKVNIKITNKLTSQ